MSLPKLLLKGPDDAETCTASSASFAGWIVLNEEIKGSCPSWLFTPTYGKLLKEQLKFLLLLQRALSLSLALDVTGTLSAAPQEDIVKAQLPLLCLTPF